MNTDLVKVFLEELGDPETRDLATGIEKIKDQVKELGRDVSAPERDAVRDELLSQLQTDFWSRQQDRLAELKNRISQHVEVYKHRHDSDAARMLLELEQTRLRLETATPEELKAEATAYGAAETPEEMHRRPEDLRLLAKELLMRGRAEVDGDPTLAAAGLELLKDMKARHADEPWRFEGDGPELYAEAEVAAANQYGLFAVRDTGGRVQSFPIAQLLEGD